MKEVLNSKVKLLKLMVLIYLLIVCAVFAHINTNISDQEKLQKILDGVF